MHCDLKDLYLKQEELDLEIAKNHNINYEVTRHKRILALLVELGEFANTTRTFKFWSNKGMESKEVVLDEFADGLHFLLSLGIDKGYVLDYLDVEDEEMNLTDNLLTTYSLISEYKQNQTLDNYVSMFSSYLRALYKIGIDWSEAKNAYYIKLKENHHRQETNY